MSIFKRIFENVRAQVGSFSGNEARTDYGDFDRFDEESDSRREFRKERKKANGKNANPKLMDCYAALEIPYGSDLKTARNAWKTLLKKYHPDRHHQDPKKHETATRIAAEITASYKYIENSLKN